jgi:hypothetical protein
MHHTPALILIGALLLHLLLALLLALLLHFLDLLLDLNRAIFLHKNDNMQKYNSIIRL